MSYQLSIRDSINGVQKAPGVDRNAGRSKMRDVRTCEPSDTTSRPIWQILYTITKQQHAFSPNMRSCTRIDETASACPWWYRRHIPAMLSVTFHRLLDPEPATLEPKPTCSNLFVAHTRLQNRRNRHGALTLSCAIQTQGVDSRADAS